MAKGDCAVGIRHNQTFPSQVGYLNSLQFGAITNQATLCIYEWAFVWAPVFIFIYLFEGVKYS